MQSSAIVLDRRLKMYFLQILPLTERNWQEKPSYEAVPIAMCGIIKLQFGSDRKELMKRKINYQHS